MISIVLYGRNDNHGYNLHKRAAISLNAMSQVLNDPDDEVLFVDYNTPDDLPTFPEAIADTLTSRARDMLRVLRVRPASHAPFRSKTHLLALESISRNVAVRRSNPKNRWILSTNTDMIFVPHDPHASLSEIAADLSDGFYQLPRFELPENMWESFDRLDAPGIISRTRELGARFHLNEIVYGSERVLYDGPGDFQLCLRADLLVMNGFHEGMLRGWHVDANLCARMIARRGRISSLESALYGYHCDHTRQVTPSHQHNRAENDSTGFVDAPQTPTLKEQADVWGLPHEHIEEIRLGENPTAARYLGALEAAIPARQTERYESVYRPDSYGATKYRKAHVLPFVVDLISAYPEGVRVLFVGARADMCVDVATACASLSSEVIIPEELGPMAGCDDIPRMALGAAIEEADLLIFEFGASEPGAPVDWDTSERLVFVRRAITRAAAVERRRVTSGASPRRFVAINAIHNEYESLVNSLMTTTLTPYSARLRSGYVFSDIGVESPVGFDVRAVWSDIRRIQERARSIPPWETQEIERLARLAVEAPPDAPLFSEVLVSAAPVIALLRHRQVEQVCAVEPEAARAAADRLEVERPGVGVRRALYGLYGAKARDKGLKSLSRVADMSDWEDPVFASFVDQHFGGDRAIGYPDRNLWTWERATALHVLSRAGLLSPDTRALLVSTVPDALAMAMRDYIDDVQVARARGRFGPLLAPVELGESDPQGFERSLAGWLPGAPSKFDAVVFCQQSMMRRGLRGLIEAIREAYPLLAPNGLLVFSAGVCLLGWAGVNEFKIEAMLGASLNEALRQSEVGLEFCGPLELALTNPTCDRIVDHARGDLRYRRMLSVRGRSIGAEAVLTFRRTSDAPLNNAGLAKVGELLGCGLSADVRFWLSKGRRALLRLVQVR